MFDHSDLRYINKVVESYANLVLLVIYEKVEW